MIPLVKKYQYKWERNLIQITIVFFFNKNYFKN